MKMIAQILTALTLVAACVDASAARHKDSTAAGIVSRAPDRAQQTAAAAPKPVELTDAEKKMYRDLSRTAWSYFERYYQPRTGLVSASPDWPNTTMWDIGGQLIASVAAKDLGYLSADDYQKRMSAALNTLEKAPLYRNAAFNKEYSARTGTIATERTGWSATDLGRFLLALKLVANHDPAFAGQAARIAHRIDFSQVVKDGYLYGQLIGKHGEPWSYQEGRIGYEQYVAKGFDAWGANVGNALDLMKNAKPVDVLGVRLLKDSRGQDRLVSEPFILYGIEVGLDGDMRGLAENVLKAQEARFTSTGRMTISSEDAVSVAPEYFYYYCVYCNGKPFIIDAAVPGSDLDKPRWVSTKGAFGWNALLPSDYTRKAIDYVTPALDSTRGWASGVYEDSRRSTQTFDINTAAVLMEIALYRLRGDVPLLTSAPAP